MNWLTPFKCLLWLAYWEGDNHKIMCNTEPWFSIYFTLIVSDHMKWLFITILETPGGDNSHLKYLHHQQYGALEAGKLQSCLAMLTPTTTSWWQIGDQCVKRSQFCPLIYMQRQEVIMNFQPITHAKITWRWLWIEYTCRINNKENRWQIFQDFEKSLYITV